MIKVITLEREYGSGGALIARKLAERLGWKLWDQLLTDELARSMKCGHEDVQRREERRDPQVRIRATSSARRRSCSRCSG